MTNNNTFSYLNTNEKARQRFQRLKEETQELEPLDSLIEKGVLENDEIIEINDIACSFRGSRQSDGLLIGIEEEIGNVASNYEYVYNSKVKVFKAVVIKKKIIKGKINLFNFEKSIKQEKKLVRSGSKQKSKMGLVNEDINKTVVLSEEGGSSLSGGRMFKKSVIEIDLNEFSRYINNSVKNNRIVELKNNYLKGDEIIGCMELNKADCGGMKENDEKDVTGQLNDRIKNDIISGRGKNKTIGQLSNCIRNEIVDGCIKKHINGQSSGYNKNEIVDGCIKNDINGQSSGYNKNEIVGGCVKNDINGQSSGYNKNEIVGGCVKNDINGQSSGYNKKEINDYMNNSNKNKTIVQKDKNEIMNGRNKNKMKGRIASHSNNKIIIEQGPNKELNTYNNIIVNKGESIEFKNIEKMSYGGNGNYTENICSINNKIENPDGKIKTNINECNSMESRKNILSSDLSINNYSYVPMEQGKKLKASTNDYNVINNYVYDPSCNSLSKNKKLVIKKDLTIQNKNGIADVNTNFNSFKKELVKNKYESISKNMELESEISSENTRKSIEKFEELPVVIEDSILNEKGSKKFKTVSISTPKKITTTDVLISMVIKKVSFRDLKLNQITKIGEASFSDVFEDNNEIYKIIPLGDNENTTSLDSFCKECYLMYVMREEKCVVKLKRAYIATEYTQEMINAFNKFKDLHGTESQDPSNYSKKQKFGVIVMENGGKDLEKYKFKNTHEIVSFLKLLLEGVSNLEQTYEFEHRDLHWGNILIKNEDGEIKINIIDFSISRIRKNYLVFTDLNDKEWLFTGDEKVDEQFGVYRKMRDICMSDWSIFSPNSNVLWVEYLVNKIANGVNNKMKITWLLSELKKIIKRSGSVSDIYKKSLPLFDNY